MTKKIICLGIIYLLIASGVSSFSAIAQNMDSELENYFSNEKFQSYTTSNTYGDYLYVGGIGPGNYSKIQDAIDNASDGDTIFVYDDSSPYYESIIVDKSVNLIGEHKNTTIIEGNNELDCLVILSSDNVRVSGFTLKNPKYGIELLSNHNTIVGNIIKNCARGVFAGSSPPAEYNTIAENILIDTGIAIETWGTQAVLSNYTIINNTILNCGSTGIVICGTEDSVISGNIIMNHNLAGDDRHSGIYVTFLCIRNIISGNTITSPANECKGIMVDQDCYENSIYDNTIMDHLWGMWLGRGFYDNKIYKNKVINNTYAIYVTPGAYGIDISGNVFSENTITNNYHGISLDAGFYCIHENTFSSNVIKENTYGIYCVSGSGTRVGETHKNNITENNIIDNDYGLYSDKHFYNNTIYHNNFINNRKLNVYNNLKFLPVSNLSELIVKLKLLLGKFLDNNWDNNAEGNYWDDYRGLSDPTSFDPDQDGIGNKPYRIRPYKAGNFLVGNMDKCPLMKPFGEENEKSSQSVIQLKLGKNDEYTPHEPIYIYGDDDFTEENGVTAGSGTQNDPYIIENWNVTKISIWSTTKFFVINHCYVSPEGISFDCVSNGKIKDCEIKSDDTYDPIRLRESNNNFIDNCKIFAGKYGNGVHLIYSNNNLIENCFISGLNSDWTGYGIKLGNSNYNTIYRCNIKHCMYGIYLSGRIGSNNNVIHCCNISNCIKGGGIKLSLSKNNKIYHNNFFENYYFIEPIKTRHNAEVSGGINQWDNGKEGNYWDNYKGLKFPRLYDWNNDGIGEIPYRIRAAPLPWGLWLGPTGNRDRHPLMKPYIEN